MPAMPCRPPSNDLGLPPEELDRHIGIDIGALGVAHRLAERLGAPLVWQRYSRLVIDCNRLNPARHAMAEVADGTEVPGNRILDEEASAARAEEIIRPITPASPSGSTTGWRRGNRRSSSPCTASRRGCAPRPADRPWHIGLCWASLDRFSRHVLRACARRRQTSCWATTSPTTSTW
jgi:predicted N-formylglutamate amidohydrolase